MDGKENLRSWLVLSVVTFSEFLEVGVIKAFSVLLPSLREQLETKTWIVGSSIAIITGFGCLVGIFFGKLRIISGRTIDRMNPSQLKKLKRLHKPELVFKFISGGTVRTETVSLCTPSTPARSSSATAVEHIPHQEEIPPATYVPDNDLQGPSTERKSSQTWSCLRKQLYMLQLTLGKTGYCVSCAKEIQLNGDHIRCNDCGKFGFFCSRECCLQKHTNSCNAFHKVEEWLSSEQCYKPYHIGIKLHRPTHSCTSGRTRSGIQVYDRNGRVHIIEICTCKCEEEVLTFLRHGLWPATTKGPRTAFHVELLNVIMYMMLEGHTSLLGACNTFRWANNLTAKQGDTLYDRLRGEPMEEYRQFVYQTHTLEFMFSELDDGFQCLACPQESGDLFISMDANFGLVRKKSAGSSVGSSRHGTRMFKEYIDSSSVCDDGETSQIGIDNCNNFTAGSTLRSSKVNRKLDVTGVFGSACRHGIPQAFMDLEKGESLQYPVSMIEGLLDKVQGKNLNLRMLYDIACKLDKNMQARDRAYEGVTMAVPVFHAYGHKPSCQVQYSVRWKDGYGLTDGEMMERLWAYLRRFSFSTKEMTSPNRHDLLTDALLHYAKKKTTNIGLTSGYFVNRFNPRAIVMTSSLIASVGLIVCSLASSPLTLLIGLLLTGSLLLQENVLMGVIPDYFDTNYATAVGIYSCGTGLGIVIFPVVTQFILEVYGWRGTLLLLSGVSFHSVPCGAVLAFREAVDERSYGDHTYHKLINHAYDKERHEEGYQCRLQILLQKVASASGLTLFRKPSFILEVVIPSFAEGYVLTGWMIYTVSFAVSRGLSIKQGSMVATTGGIGLILSRISIRIFHKVWNCKQLIYTSSLVTALSLSLTAFCESYIALNIVSLLFGAGVGILGAEIYIAAKANSEDSEYHFAVAWLHVAYGASSILSGVFTGLVYDTTGSFTVSFNLLAVMSLSISLSLGLGHLLGNNE